MDFKLRCILLLEFVVLDEKMSSFSITRKKTPFQKHREEEEAKKKVNFHQPTYIDFVVQRKRFPCDLNWFVLCDREQRMKLLGYMLNLWSHFKGITHQGQRLLFEGEQSILMRDWRQSLKVSLFKELCFLLLSIITILEEYYHGLFLFLFYTMDNEWFFHYGDLLIKVWTFYSFANGRWKVQRWGICSKEGE